MIMRCGVLFLLSVLGTCAFAQELITTSEVTGIEVTEQIQTYRLDINGDGKPDIEEVTDESEVGKREIPATLITINSAASNIRVAVEDQSRNRVELQKLSDTQYLATEPGKFYVRVTVVDFAANIFDEQAAVIEVGPSEPENPTPPAEPSLKVLIVYETSEVTREVGDIVASPIIRSYLSDRCKKDVNGGPLFRFIDKDAKFQDCTDNFWCSSLDGATTVPWISISNGTDSYSGALPATVTQTLDLLKKYGG